MTLHEFLLLPLLLALTLLGFALPFVSPVGLVAWAMIGTAWALRKHRFHLHNIDLWIYAMGCQSLLDLVFPRLGDVTLLVSGLVVVAVTRTRPTVPRAVLRCPL